MKYVLRFLFLINVLFITYSTAFALSNKNTDTLKHVSEAKYFSDDQVAARLDELSESVLFSGKNTYSDTLKLNIYNFKADEVPQYTDEEYISFFKSMNAHSPFPFVFNEDVRKFIDLYAQKRRSLTSRLLGLAAYYFPLFEEKLDMYNLPLELKYLAVIESALNPVAVSRAGASGLWQFMYGTGKIYGLEVTSYVDDRYDPYKATIAACEHFEDLYNIYNDWTLVLAAYNAGSGNVNRAIRRAGGEMDYWKIRRFMPRETQNYVPVYIAAAFVMSHAAEHNLYPIYPGYLFSKTDTVTIREKITFEQLSEALAIPINEIITLNPNFKKNVIPACKDIQYKIRLPYNKIGEFLSNEEEIYNFKTLEQLIKEDYAIRNNIKTPVFASHHTVSKGETLSVIAKKYGCTIANIQKWNNLKSTTIHIGQKLVVNNQPPKQEPVIPKPPVNTVKEFYVVEANQTLRDISKIYNCSVDNIRLWNNITNLNLVKGQELVIHIPVPEDINNIANLDTAKDSLKDNKLNQNDNGLEKNVEDKENVIVMDNNDYKTESANNGTELSKVESSKTESEIQYIYHTVQKGDTLWNIAQRYESVTVEDIKKLNSLKDGTLKLGQKLKLPVKEKS